MHKNSLSTFILFVVVAIVFLIGGYAAGAGYFGNQEASLYNRPTTAAKASWFCQQNPQHERCKNTITKQVNVETTGPTGGDKPSDLIVKITFDGPNCRIDYYDKGEEWYEEGKTTKEGGCATMKTRDPAVTAPIKATTSTTKGN